MSVLRDKGIGAEQNAELSRTWFEKAAVQRDSDAQANLGLMCVTGEG